jgi:hypothetical protein
MGMVTKLKYVISAAVAILFMAAAYYSPAELFMVFVLGISPGIPLAVTAALTYKLFFEKRRKPI